MYYEEKIINGIMHYRTIENGFFIPYTMEELSRRYQDATRRADQYQRRIVHGYRALMGKELRPAETESV